MNEIVARRHFEDAAVLQINQLRAMVNEVAPRVETQHRGAISARRNQRAELQRQQWEGMMWHGRGST